MIKPYISLILVLLILALGVAVYSHHRQAIQDIFISKSATLQSISLENHQFVVHGQGLSKVELWAIPTGTNVTEREYTHIGDLQLASKNEFGEVWQMPVPENPMLVTTLFVKSFDANNKESGRVTWSVTGATDIYNALWGNIQNAPGEVSDPNSQQVTLKPGQKTLIFSDLTMTFVKVIQDSRCPVDVQCIQAGNFTVSLLLESPTDKKTVTVSQVGEPAVFGNYHISIDSIEPEKKSTNTENTVYRVHFVVTDFSKMRGS